MAHQRVRWRLATLYTCGRVAQHVAGLSRGDPVRRCCYHYYGPTRPNIATEADYPRNRRTRVLDSAQQHLQHATGLSYGDPVSHCFYHQQGLILPQQKLIILANSVPARPIACSNSIRRRRCRSTRDRTHTHNAMLSRTISADFLARGKLTIIQFGIQ